MSRGLFFGCLSIMIFTSAPRAGATESVVQQGNGWSRSQPIPVDLLTYRKSGFGAAYTPAPEDTSSVIGAITNSALLVEILFDPRLDGRVFASVVDRALRLIGPQSFFGEIGRRYQQKPEWLLYPPHKRLFAEMQQRHAVVDAFFISQSDMPENEAMETMQKLISELQSGKTWEGVFSQYSQSLRGDAGLAIAGDKAVSVSKVSKFGPVILCEGTSASETLVSDPLPKEHRAALLAGAQGQVLLTGDPPRRRVVLYRLREVYLPGQPTAKAVQ